MTPTPPTAATPPSQSELVRFIALSLTSLVFLLGAFVVVAACGAWLRLLARTFLFGWHLAGTF